MPLAYGHWVIRVNMTWVTWVITVTRVTWVTWVTWVIIW